MHLNLFGNVCYTNSAKSLLEQINGDKFDMTRLDSSIEFEYDNSKNISDYDKSNYEDRLNHMVLKFIENNPNTAFSTNNNRLNIVALKQWFINEHKNDPQKRVKERANRICDTTFCHEVRGFRNANGNIDVLFPPYMGNICKKVNMNFNPHYKNEPNKLMMLNFIIEQLIPQYTMNDALVITIKNQITTMSDSEIKLAVDLIKKLNDGEINLREADKYRDNMLTNNNGRTLVYQCYRPSVNQPSQMTVQPQMTVQNLLAEFEASRKGNKKLYDVIHMLFKANQGTKKTFNTRTLEKDIYTIFDRVGEHGNLVHPIITLIIKTSTPKAILKQPQNNDMYTLNNFYFNDNVVSYEECMRQMTENQGMNEILADLHRRCSDFHFIDDSGIQSGTRNILC